MRVRTVLITIGQCHTYVTYLENREGGDLVKRYETDRPMQANINHKNAIAVARFVPPDQKSPSPMMPVKVMTDVMVGALRVSTVRLGSVFETMVVGEDGKDYYTLRTNRLDRARLNHKLGIRRAKEYYAMNTAPPNQRRPDPPKPPEPVSMPDPFLRQLDID